LRLYLDTSALVSIYFPEPHTMQTPVIVAKATKLLTSYATYAEASAALAQIRHAKRIRKNAYEIAIERLENEWVSFERFEVNGRTTRLAGLLAREYLLKGYDSIQLSTALVMRADKIFTYDHKLARVATSVGLDTLN
jgi:predicted nucleic acid-binding protein